jgi:D-3-phosphoglycerate dehydrogenase
MAKAYCVFEGFSEEARNIIGDAGIDLTVNTTKDRPNGEELIALLKEYDILIMGIFSKLTADMIQYVDKPKIIATMSVGIDHIDQSFVDSPLVTFISLKTANAVSVAEHILGLALALNKRIYEGNHLVLEGDGHRNSVHERPEDISGKTLGLLGAGNITKELIRMAKAFDMGIKCFTKNPDNHQDLREHGVEFLPLDEVLKQADSDLRKHIADRDR